jgi:transcriptional regulator with XRE-family HTH domain
MDNLRIRVLRIQHGLTVAQLASAAGVSGGLISQVERGLADPSLETLRRISVVLEVPLFELFAAPPEKPKVSILRRGDHVEISSSTSAIRYRRLTAVGGQLEVLQGELAPGGASSDAVWTHPAEEAIVVISGMLTAEVDGQFFTLAPGDSCHFDSRLPHRFRNDGNENAVWIVSVTPPSY